jgi:4-hydroxy-3-methylbut-2-enyl diphosphate reductase
VRDHIKFEESYTPLTWATRHNLAKGATHGLSHTLTQMGLSAAYATGTDATGTCTSPGRAHIRARVVPTANVIRPLGSAAHRRRASLRAATDARPGVERVILVSPRGFCAGVVRAIATVERALAVFGPPVYVRRAIVHNAHVVARLARRRGGLRR